MPLFRTKAFVGLDMGHRVIKAVQLEKSPSGGWRVTKMASTATPTSAIRDGVVAEVDVVGQAIKDLLRNARFNANAAMVAVAGGAVTVRNIRLPKMPEATLRKSIKLEAGRYVPSSIEDSYIEFEIIGPAPDGQMEVLIVAAPKEIVESRLRACAQAGLDVEVVDVEAFATYRALVEADESPFNFDNTIALVDVGSASTNVSVVNKGNFAMTRSIPQAGQTFTEALQNFFKLSPEDAETGKSQLDLRSLLGEAAPTENPPLRVLQPHVDELVREIRRSLNYYQSQQTEQGQPKPVARVLLSGGGAAMKGLPDYLANRLGIEVKEVGIFDNPRFTSGGVEDPGKGLEFAVATGLAMRAFAKAG